MVKKKILILGGSGFVGANIFKYLTKNKFITYSISRSNGYDLRDQQKLIELLKKKKFDFIVNSAAHVGGLSYIKKYCADVAEDNLRIYINLYSALKNIKNKPQIINLISNCVYPHKLILQNENLIFDGEIHESVDCFGLSKLVLIKLSKYYFHQYKIKTLNLILPNVYGHGDHLDTTRSHALNGIITRMIENKNNNFYIWGTGKPKREWLYVSDISRIVKIVLSKKKFFKDFDHINVAQNQSYSINFIAKLVKKFLNSKTRLINDVSYPDGALLKQLDNKKFKKYFNNFKFTPFNVGLSETIKYYQKVIKL